MLSVLECHGPCMRLLVVAVLSLAACAPVAAPPSRGDDNARAPATSGPCAELPADVASGSHGVLEQTRGALSGLVVLMGGGSEVDRGSAQFVEAALGGDVLVLRASGSTESYTSYFAQELVVDLPPASVTTLLLDDPSLAADPAVLCRIDGAEAIWLAGGDQADYLVRWPEQLRAAIARAVNDGVAIGGTSAGAMSLSSLAFDALLGGVTSAEALAAPNDDVIRVVTSPFAPPVMAGTLVDTHFVARAREGRLLAFLDRALVAGAARITGVGLDESGTALVIDGASFTLLADDGAQAFLYDVSGPEDAEVGALDLDFITRVRLADGDEGPWPPSFAGGEPLEVKDGVLR